MRILLFCDEDLGIAAGGSRQVLEFTRALAARGHELAIVAPRSRTPRQSWVPMPHLRLREVPVLRAPGLRPLSFLLLSGLILLVDMIRWKPNVLLWFDAPGQVSPLCGARMLGCPYVLFVNGLPGEEIRGLWGWPPIRGILNVGLKAAARRAASVVSISQEILHWMQREWGIEPSRCTVVLNGVDPGRFRPVDSRGARQTLGLEDAGLYVGFVGGFFPWHGMDLLIDAVPEVLQKVPTAQFLLVGDGPDREALEARVRSMNLAHAVRFPGRAGFEDVPTWIGACDVCVVLHRPLRSYPGDSMKLWEYLACGRPVVASAGPGYGQAVEAFGAGLAAGIENPHEIATALVRLLTNPELRASMGQNGRAAVVKEHTWSARAAQMESLLRQAGTT